jgi:DNA mismatch repair ATPase MutS
MFFQVGCFFEFYRGQTKKVARWLRLKKGRGRRSLGTGVGLPVRRTRLDELTNSAGVPVAVILQNSRPAGGTLQRRLSQLYVKKTLH